MLFNETLLCFQSISQSLPFWPVLLELHDSTNQCNFHSAWVHETCYFLEVHTCNQLFQGHGAVFMVDHRNTTSIDQWTDERFQQNKFTSIKCINQWFCCRMWGNYAWIFCDELCCDQIKFNFNSLMVNACRYSLQRYCGTQMKSGSTQVDKHGHVGGKVDICEVSVFNEKAVWHYWSQDLGS